ncbi:uncharacterized protein SPSK_08190 [Sporothrix schenckii 1099-18]|uniref:Uncharacterized protein n=1 Tax=Sporothrix schenckii 1099-18 TaxID=1397361 RepID=A0A0F2MFV8_SPOSC|nr:uncharacterized protein SPSK_08190 [Sporothrix schenckii 1099-18]KJR87939.1 hypothetical protein SPSK_08190 [Sporothrix schenckii 1099-18]
MKHIQTPSRRHIVASHVVTETDRTTRWGSAAVAEQGTDEKILLVDSWMMGKVAMQAKGQGRSKLEIQNVFMGNETNIPERIAWSHLRPVNWT